MRRQAYLKRLTDEQLSKLRVNLGLYLDHLFESNDRRDKLQIHNVRRQIWSVMDEQDYRKQRRCA
ncbi:MAG TPA: hypothetical protein VNL14_13975 [Candidatus Acidoferrales bacterium]|nr:hypothetical protein [Candidatus Acidoferrales bacterium]